MMKKFMVLVNGDGETSATFFDDIYAAENYRQTAECGLGYYAEIYERIDHEYKMLY